MKKCYILTVLKLAESYAQAMILALLPYILWKYLKTFGEEAAAIAKWFKPAAQMRVAEVYWDPKDECVKNTSNKMLTQVSMDTDNLYWISNVPPPSQKQKQKHMQAEEELLNDSISMVKTVASKKKKPTKSALKMASSN